LRCLAKHAIGGSGVPDDKADEKRGEPASAHIAICCAGPANSAGPSTGVGQETRSRPTPAPTLSTGQD
jgi:hypothetical protein